MNTSVTNNPPFQVGQKVVCVDDSSSGFSGIQPCTAIKKGQVFTIKGIQKGCCLWQVDIGFKTKNKISRCTVCGKRKEDDRWWMRATRFAPIQETYTDIREELATGAMNVGDTSDITPFTKRELQNKYHERFARII